MPPLAPRRLAFVAVSAGVLLIAGFTGLVLHYSGELRAEIRRKMIERDAAVLSPVAEQQIEESAAAVQSGGPGEALLRALLPDARREGLLALAIFDADGVTLEQVPSDQLLVELPFDDFIHLRRGERITRYFPAFRMRQLFPGAPAGAPTPVLEIVLPLRLRDSDSPPGPGAPATELVGFVRYHLDARALAGELAALDRTVGRQTMFTLTLGIASVALVVIAAYGGLRRAQRTIQERTERLQRANFDLALAAKASALGQITSHLIHGLQGSVAGLSAVVHGREAGSSEPSDWKTAAGYTERMQALIQETVGLLGDRAAQATYALTGHELLAIAHARNRSVAEAKQVRLEMAGGFAQELDNHRGGLLCLIVANLVQNAIDATPAGGRVEVRFMAENESAIVLVSDEGAGISEEIRAHLFEPGRTGRPGGTGLGLAISQLLARQIGATLTLDSTGLDGTAFRLVVPFENGSAIH